MKKEFQTVLYNILTVLAVLLLVFISCLTLLFSFQFFLKTPGGFISSGYTPNIKYIIFAICIMIGTLMAMVAAYKSMLKDLKIDNGFLFCINCIASFISFIIILKIMDVNYNGLSSLLGFLFIFILAIIPSMVFQFAIKKHSIKEGTPKPALLFVFVIVGLSILLFCTSFIALLNESF